MVLRQQQIISDNDGCLFTGKFAKKNNRFCHVIDVKKSFWCLKDLGKESINCLECCEKWFMEELIIKLYSKNNCGLRSPGMIKEN